MWSQSNKSPGEFAEHILKEADQYNGFNLILVDLCNKAMVYVSNRPKDNPRIIEVTPGIHVLTNASLDAAWPKVRVHGEQSSCYLQFHPHE